MSAALGAIFAQHEFNAPLRKMPASYLALARQAMASPGQIQYLGWEHQQAPLDEATFALCLALLDECSRVWLGPSMDTPSVRAALALHCGCSIVERRQVACFALLGGAELDDLADFDTGSDGCPGNACTLIIQIGSLSSGPVLRWRGPGIRQATCKGLVDVRRVSLPLTKTFWQQRSARNHFPQGLDIYFSAGQQVLALPRSAHVLGDEADTG